MNANFYKIEILANSGGTTNFVLGEKSGGRGISGCLLKAGSKAFDFIATNTNIDKLLIYGTTFYNADTVSFPPDATDRESISNNFEACGEVLPDTCITQYCNIINADNRGLRIDSASHNVSDCNLINCPHCVHIPADITVTFDNLQFSGSDGVSKYDIEHSTSGSLTINATNGSNPSHVAHCTIN